MNTPTLSVVVPCYNEENRLQITFRELRKFSEFSRVSFEVVFVDDGSTDKTLDKIRNFITYNIQIDCKLVSYKKNKGKGFAVRKGLGKCIGKYCLYTDCDFSTPLSEVYRIIPQLTNNYSLIYGVRENGHNSVIRKTVSKLFTKIRYTLIPSLNSVKDSQCGFKCMTSEIAHLYAKIGKVNGFVFDLELLLFTSDRGVHSKGITVPWQAVPGGHVVEFKTLFSVLLELLSLIRNGGM